WPRRISPSQRNCIQTDQRIRANGQQCELVSGVGQRSWIETDELRGIDANGEVRRRLGGAIGRIRASRQRRTPGFGRTHEGVQGVCVAAHEWQEKALSSPRWTRCGSRGSAGPPEPAEGRGPLRAPCLVLIWHNIVRRHQLARTVSVPFDLPPRLEASPFAAHRVGWTSALLYNPRRRPWAPVWGRALRAAFSEGQGWSE